MTDLSQWKHKDEWKRHGDQFLVVISRHEVAPSDHEGPNRWCVYAYIYPGHRLFPSFKGNDMWQDAATALPLHCGPSFFRWTRDDGGKPLSVQVGADYNHLHDEHFTNCATPNDALRVFMDADQLFAHLDRPLPFPEYLAGG